MSRLLAISGSLRAQSSNAELLRAVARICPPGVTCEWFAGLGTLPHFNPDLDTEGAELPPAVQELRRAVDQADGILISSPEYAHGVPGTLKNALDWLVSGPEIIHKPIGLLNPSPRSTYAQASLAETLRTMSTVVVPETCIAVPVSGRGLDAEMIVRDPELRTPLESALKALLAAVPDYQAWRASMRRG